MQHSLIVIIWSLFVSFHDFHVTHTTIYYNADKESLEITVNVAIEDLERALEDQTAKKISIGTNAETESVDQLIEAYFRQRLTLAPNNHLTHYQWVGKEVSQDLHNIYIYFEVLDCNQNGMIESLLIENKHDEAIECFFTQNTWEPTTNISIHISCSATIQTNTCQIE